MTGFSWRIDPDKKSAICIKYFGKKLLISDRQAWSMQEILETYNNQYYA